MSDSRKQNKDADGNVLPQAATPDAVAKDAAAAAPKQDELQKRREAVADAGLAHGSMNNGIPHSKDDFSEAERLGDEAHVSPDNVSENTKRANAENDAAVGASSTVGQPAVGSNELRDPGVDSSATSDLPKGEAKPADTVKGSGDGKDSQDSVEKKTEGSSNSSAKKEGSDNSKAGTSGDKTTKK